MNTRKHLRGRDKRERKGKIMKKLLALLLTGTMAFSLAACGGSSDGGSSEKDSAKTEGKSDGKTLRLVNGKIEVDKQLKKLAELYKEETGVTVEVPIDMNYHDPIQGLSIELKAGKQKLDGEHAMMFMRFRKNDDGTGYPLSLIHI